MKMAQFVRGAATLFIIFGVVFNSRASENETTIYLSNELPTFKNRNNPTDASAAVSQSYTTDEDAETTTKITIVVTVKTETDANEETETTSTTTAFPKRTQGPHYHLPNSKWGPFFEEGPGTVNVTVRLGASVILDCRVGLLQDKTVTWLQHKDNSIQLLTVGKAAHSRDDRFSLKYRYPNNYRLEIDYVTRRDEGLYECQVSTHPPKVKRTYIKVTAPEIRISDESGREVTERYYKAGSALELTCSAAHVGAVEDEQPIIWRHGECVLADGISSNVSTVTDSAISTLTITPLAKKHSGNYTCAVGALVTATVSVHVLNGELPAAVHGSAVPVGAVPNIAIALFAVFLVAPRR